jgi:uncharacterized protein (DUF1778 family)
MDAYLRSELALVDGAARLAGHTRPQRGYESLARFVVNVITEKNETVLSSDEKFQLTMVPVKAVMSDYRDDRSA